MKDNILKFPKLLCGFLILLVFAGNLNPSQAQVAVADEVIEVKSGNGNFTEKDINVTFLPLPGYAEKPRALTASDFSGALSGHKAWVVEPFTPWLKRLNDGPAAKWVSTQNLSTNEGTSALYAVPFRVQTQNIESVSFEISFAVDDYLTYQDQVGVFVNQTQLLCDNFSSKGSYNAETILVCILPSGQVSTGNNSLFFLVSNVFGPTGIMFNTRVLINPTQQAQGGAAVLGLETQNIPTITSTPSATPARSLQASPEASTSIPEELPKTGTPIELMLGFVAAGIWGYYFYRRYKIS